MADTRTKAQRRYIMQSVGVANTSPEVTVRRLLHAEGYRFRLHPRHLPGKPDIVFPSRRKVIFVHGCFWHGHGCAKGLPPKSRLDYWLPKIASNRLRDSVKQAALQELGWSFLVVWQCELWDRNTILKKIVDFLGPAKTSIHNRAELS
jgi:DNA mismatch endonuclease (patch repair protein)